MLVPPTSLPPRSMASNAVSRSGLRPLSGQLVPWKRPSVHLATLNALRTMKFPSGMDLHRNRDRFQTTTATRTVSGQHPSSSLLHIDTSLLQKLPSSWIPYAQLSRIEKPGGLYGFYMAYLIGLGYGACLATPTVSPASLAGTAGVLLVYNIFLRGAACTSNDILDREFDRKVARCRNRPIARGAVTPGQGWIWYAAQTAGAGVAVMFLPNPLLAFSYAAPIHLVVSLVYPLCKRFTDFPQLVLSAPIASGVLMAAASVGLDPFNTSSLSITSSTAALTLSHYIWTTIFDYVNACQDTPDDEKAGVRSMAVRYRDTGAFITTLGTAQVGCLVAAGVLAGFSPVYFVGAVGGNIIGLVAMAKTVKRSRPDICAWWFAWGGLVVSGTTVAGLFAEYLWNARRDEDEKEG